MTHHWIQSIDHRINNGLLDTTPRILLTNQLSDPLIII